MTNRILSGLLGLGVAIAGVSAAQLAVGTITSAVAQSAGIEGSWSGGGTVSINGNSERARCNVYYRKKGGSSYSASATCATASGKVAQSASLTQTGSNSYEGSFYNSEYGVSGSISVTVRGNKQTVYLEGGGSSGTLSLSR